MLSTIKSRVDGSFRRVTVGDFQKVYGQQAGAVGGLGSGDQFHVRFCVFVVD
jgi:hypothetical protein